MQNRLYNRYVKLKARGKNENKAIVAIARALVFRHGLCPWVGASLRTGDVATFGMSAQPFPSSAPPRPAPRNRDHPTATAGGFADGHPPISPPRPACNPRQESVGWICGSSRVTCPRITQKNRPRPSRTRPGAGGMPHSFCGDRAIPRCTGKCCKSPFFDFRLYLGQISNPSRRNPPCNRASNSAHFDAFRGLLERP